MEEGYQADPGVWVDLGSDDLVFNHCPFIHSLNDSLAQFFIHSLNLSCVHQLPDPHRQWRPCSDQDFPARRNVKYVWPLPQKRGEGASQGRLPVGGNKRVAIWKGTEGGCLQLEPGKSILGRRNSRMLRLGSLCRLCLLESGFRKVRDDSSLVSWAGVRVQ